MADLNISDAMMQVVFSAAEEGITILKSEQNLVPFALMLTKEGVVLRRFADHDIAIAIERAQTAITEADEDSLGYALVYDSQIEIAGDTVDALMIEAGERGKSDAWRFVQRYQSAKNDLPFYAVSDLAYLGTNQNLMY